MTDWESRWPFVARVTMFLGGMAIMFWQTVLEQADRPYLIAAAMGMMAPTVTSAVAGAIEGARKGGTGK